MAQVRALAGGPAVDELGDDPGAGEDDGAEVASHALLQQVRRQGVGALSGVEEDEVARGAGCAVFHYGVEGPVHQPGGQLLGVADGGRAGDVGGGAAVGGADAVEAAEEMEDVGAEDSAVGVELVDDDEFERGEEGGPVLVEGEQGGVQHVRGGDEHVRRRGLDFTAAMGGGVAVVDIHPQFPVEAPQKGLELVELVLLQGLERKDVQRPGAGVLQEGGDHRRVVDQGLAAGGGGGQGHVVALQGSFDALGLVAVQGRDPGGGDHPGHLCRQVVQVFGQALRARRDGFLVHEGMGQDAAFEGSQEG